MQILSEIDLGEYPKEIFSVEYFERKKLSKICKKDASVVVCSRGTAAELLKFDFPNLKLIQLTSAGFDGVPLEEFRHKSVQVVNASGVYGIPIAETVVFGMLEIAKRIHTSPENRRPRLARGYANYMTELSGKTVIILGTGNIGSEIAKRLAGFDMHIIGYARHSKKIPWFDEFITDKSLLLDELKDADYVVSTLPENVDSVGFVSESFLQSMKKTAWFINVGRRKTVDENTLYRILKEKHIQGAVLDMFEKIPNPFTNKFRRLSNTIVWCGLTAISNETNDRLKRAIIKNLADFEAGNLQGIVN